MRTRFLNIDYFSPSQTLEPPTFLHLPVPRLSPAPLSTFHDLVPFLSPLNVFLPIHSFPIHSALSKFFSAVLPHNIDDAKIEDLGAAVQSRSRNACFNETRLLQQEAGFLYEEKEVESQTTSGSETLQIELPKKDDGIAICDKEASRYEVIQFETHELDDFLENACFFEKEQIKILSGVPNNENNLEILRQALTMQSPHEVQELIYSVENVTAEFHMEQKAYVLEDEGIVQDQMYFHRTVFPYLEVDEMSLKSCTYFSVEEELLSFLENTEPQCWLQKGNMVINGEEVLGSREYDISHFLSDHCISNQCLEPGLASVDIFPEMDFISIMETSHIQGNSSCEGISHVDCSLLVSPVIFQEFQFLDVDSSPHFEVFFSTQRADEPETCDWMFREDMNFKNFNELIVSYELALVDNTFKSLPVPLLSDHEKIRSLCSIVVEKLADLNPWPLSVSDGIYLDWHLLEKDKCNTRIYSSYQSMLEEVDSHSFDFDLESLDDGTLLLDFVFSDNALNGQNTEEKKESQKLLFHGISVPTGHLVGGASNKLLDDECPQPGTGEHLAEKDNERASLLFKSMSQSNDLDFFLNPRKVNAWENNDSAIKAVDTNATFPKVPSSNSRAACASTGVQLQRSDILLYQVKLSDIILAIMDNFEKSYLAILQNKRELVKTDLPFLAADSFKLLSLPKQKLMDCIKKASGKRTTSHRDGNIMVFVTLCAIKQTAWYMCFYGIHPAHLYVDKLCQSMECLKSSLGIVWSLIEDAHRKVDREVTNSHPSLTSIRKILRSNTTLSDLKVLIVAEEIFWQSLKSLLVSMGLSFSEYQNYYAHANQPDLCKTDFTNARMDALLVTDCLLVSPEHVSALFPFNKFSKILEYGGSHGSSKVSSLSPELIGLPPLHFLRVELDKFSACEALCEGVDMPQNTEIIMEEDKNMTIQKLEKLLNFLPIEDKLNMGSSGAANEADCCMPLPVPTVPVPMKSENILQCMVSSPETVIIVNTQNCVKEMIISRRSTYQRILTMEKEGAQVVERDSDLPVDIIISSAICLVWYDCRNIGKKATALDEASSCLPLCIENIATNVLTSLSFAFSGCILVFEGESSFLSTIMEYSDELYAAAVSLGIDLQLFCSYSSELTDEIILSCISYGTKLTRGLYPKMPESETLAESFLAKFPSINPLTAHAILSSGGILIEFLEWSHECRIRAIQKYHVPEESVTLFGALCKYGELEDSKSIMTDCSSASSGPDSERCRFNVDFGRKRGKYGGSPQKIDVHMDEILHFTPLNQFTDDTLELSTVSKPYNSWMSKDPEIFDEISKPSLPTNGFSGQKLGLDMGMTINPSNVNKPYDFQFSESPKMSTEKKKGYFSSSDIMFGQNQASDSAMMNTLDWCSIKKSGNLNENIIGEVIDLTESPVSGQDYSSIGNSMNVSLLVPETENNSTRKHKAARKLLFGKGGHPPCSMAADIKSNSDIWRLKKDQRQTLPEGANGYPNTDFKNGIFPVKQCGVLLEECLSQRSAGNLKGLSFQENGMPSYCGTPLSNALSSAHPRQNSPWTIEFLNRIREKSRLRQQSLPCDTSSPCLGYSGNISKVSKRRSPSILEFFKYQGGSSPVKMPEQKRQKQSVQSSSSSKNKKSSSSLLPTWTPADKRARQTLSFATSGSGGQTKLVWGDKTHGLSNKFRNQI